MKIVSIVGARPNFIKVAPLHKAFTKYNIDNPDEEVQHLICHTGQHYDKNMSEIFFEEMGIPKPDFNLGIGSSTHGKQTAQMIEAIEELLFRISPNYVFVFGDTNTTLSASIAAAKLHIPIGHVEAGVRSNNKNMPEELNRILTDNLSTHLFCPTNSAVNNLKKENIKNGVFQVGDIMFDSLNLYKNISKERSQIISKVFKVKEPYFLLTLHREENTVSTKKIIEIIYSIISYKKKVIFPIHPRVKNLLNSKNLFCEVSKYSNLIIIEPVGFIDMIQLISNCDLVVTDSGGIQKEAFLLESKTLTLRDETEWFETVELGNNVVCGTKPKSIEEGMKLIEKSKPNYTPKPFGVGKTSQSIINIVSQYLKQNKNLSKK